MNNSLIKYLFLLAAVFLINSGIRAQTFGFGCLGLSGFYAGISRESYDAKGINDYLSSVNPANSGVLKFEKATGYRIGANLFRAKFENVFITAKGYYQFLKEEHPVSHTTGGSTLKTNHNLSLNHWGIGVDFGLNLFWILDWKVVEGNIKFYNSELTVEYFNDNVLTSEEKYAIDKSKIGYFVGSGLILHLVPDYISVEGTVGYNFMKIESMKWMNPQGNEIIINNPLPAGRISTTIQLNIGFPL